jgi:hypothetical protein
MPNNPDDNASLSPDAASSPSKVIQDLTNGELQLRMQDYFAEARKQVAAGCLTEATSDFFEMARERIRLITERAGAT